MTQTVVTRFDSETVARLENLAKMTGRQNHIISRKP